MTSLTTNWVVLEQNSRLEPWPLAQLGDGALAAFCVEARRWENEFVDLYAVLTSRVEAGLAGTLRDDGLWNQSEDFKAWFGAGHIFVQSERLQEMAAVIEGKHFLAFLTWCQRVGKSDSADRQAIEHFEVHFVAIGPAARPVFDSLRAGAGLQSELIWDDSYDQF